MCRKWQLHLGKALIIPRKNFADDFPLELLDRYTLQNGISLVSPMIEAALEGLQEVKNPSSDVEIGKKTGGRIQSQQKVLEVQDALAKYFNLVPTDFRFSRYVDGIIEVYKKIHIGLSNAYEIVIFHPASNKHGKSMTSTRGFVSPKRGVEPDIRVVGPIRQLFNFPVEWNHIEWVGHDVGDIGRMHLSYAYVNGHMADREEHVARTIIHEASHKFARTTDVLYKSESFGKQGISDEDLTLMQWKQPVIARMAGDKQKPLKAMAGLQGVDQINPIRFLENADSYAWTARRLWKRFRKYKY